MKIPSKFCHMTFLSFRWSPEEMTAGYLWDTFEIQGTKRTWYAGSSVSFESVRSVMAYNKLLLRQFDKKHMVDVKTEL